MQANGGGDRALCWVARQQLGLVNARQLRIAGIARGTIASRCASGSMQRRHRGVYVVGPGPLVAGARELAALLACGEDALLASWSAAGLWRFARPLDAEVRVMVIARNCRSRAGVRVQRVSRLDPQDRAAASGIPVTAPARTLVDLAADATDSELERAVAEGYVLRLVTDAEILAAIARAPRYPGVDVLRGLVTRSGGPAFTRSEAERRLLALVRDAQLPVPLANRRVAGHELDFVWPAQRLVVEVDGHRYHANRFAFERDRKRDAALLASGYRVLRVTWRQIVDEPFLVVANVARALAV